MAVSDGILQGLMADLAADAAKMAAGETVSRDVEQRAIGRIGLMVCEFAKMFWTEEELRQIVYAAIAERIASHAAACAQIRAGEGCAAAGEGGASGAPVLFPCTVWGRVWLLLDRHFNSLWWGFVLLCLGLGVNRVVDAVLSVLRAVGVGGAGALPG